MKPQTFVPGAVLPAVAFPGIVTGFTRVRHGVEIATPTCRYARRKLAGPLKRPCLVTPESGLRQLPDLCRS